MSFWIALVEPGAYILAAINREGVVLWARCTTGRGHLLAILLPITSVVACQDAIAPPRQASPAEATTAETPEIDATFTITDLGTLAGGTNSYGEAINASGDVAGISTVAGGLQHAVIWVGTTVTDLGVPFGTQSAAFGINDGQTVVGYTTDGTTKYAVLWKNGGFTLISGPTSPQSTSASAVNNNDVVTGYFLDAGTSFHAYRYSAATGLVDIHPAGFAQSVGLGINDNGVIAGYVQLANGSTHAARWTSSNVFSDLGTLGGDIGQAEAVNSAGTIVGESEEASGKISAFTWRANTSMVGTGLGGYALGISNAGRVVGYKPLPNKSVAATGKNTTTITVLPLLPLGVNSFAVGVNTCGHIAGIADIPGGAYRAVRWTIGACD